MAKFLTARGVSYEIENIIKNAKHSLFLISPYVSIPETLLQSLKDVDRQNVKTTFVYGKERLKQEAMSALQQLNNLSLYFLKNLHAKCYYNEGHMVITSLNLFDYSEQNNREMGVLISITEDKAIFEEALNEANLIINLSTRLELRTPEVRAGSRDSKPSHPARADGFCIRCKVTIPLNLDKPMCRNCFSKWSEWGNPYYEENCCHTCGKSEVTTIDKPLCYSCYKKLFG